MGTSADPFPKWRRWLGRVLEEQLDPLLINRHIYRQLSDCLKEYDGTYQGAELAVWMDEGYVAFAATRIRCMIEEPNPRWRSVSLVILLRDLRQHHAKLTRERFRRMYRRHRVSDSSADRDFDAIARSRRAACVSSTRIERDIAALKRAAAPVKRLVDKVVAHTEQDRRRVGSCKYNDLDKAIHLLEETFRRYRLLIHGSCPDPLVRLDDFDVTDDLRKIWP
jgi:hypothetical protein